MKLISGILVFGFGVFLIFLSVLCVFFKSESEKFLSSFASSPQAHFLEIGIRLLVGAGLVTFAEEMWFPSFFRFFGWILILTTVVLMLIPWRFHQKFSQLSVPPIIRHLNFFAFGALTLGIFIFYGLSKMFIST